MKTRAAVLREIGRRPPFAESTPLTIEDVELDGPGPGEVLVRVVAAGLCHSDLSVADGARPRPVPMVLGHEAAGIVEALGPGVTELTEGDRVVCSYLPSCGMCAECAGGRPVLCATAQAANREARLVTGRRPFTDADGAALHQHLGVSAFAEHTVMSPRSLIKVPDDVPLEVAAVFGCAVLTGVGAVLNTADVRPGDSVAVFGLGGVGLSAVMGAALAGAWPIVAVDLVEDKLALARELGAHHTVRAGEGNEVDQIRELTGGGVQWAVEAAGSARVLELCYAALRAGGTAVAAGLPHPNQDFTVKAVTFVAEEKTVKGSYMGSAAPRRDLPRLFDLYRAGRLPVDKLLTRRNVGFDDLNEALDRLHTGTEVRQLLEPQA